MSQPTDTKRVQIKFFAQSDGELPPIEAVVPIFHAWIRANALGELLIDVADYAHVPDGPGIVLIGHGSDYYYDLAEGRLGLLYSRKRGFEGDAEARLADGFRRAVHACRLLERAEELGGKVRFKTDELLIRFPDRLLAPNDEATRAILQPIVQQALGKLYDAPSVHIEPLGTPREPLTFRVAIDDAPPLSALDR